MVNLGELNHEDDFISLTVDIEGCPIAELPLTEIYETETSMLKEDYLNTFRSYITQQLEDTSWLEDQSVSPLFDAGFATFQRRDNGDVITLRKPALQRHIQQLLRARSNNVLPLSIPLFIRFMVSDSLMPTRVARSEIPSVVGGTINSEREGSIQDPSEIRSPTVDVHLAAPAGNPTRPIRRVLEHSINTVEERQPSPAATTATPIGTTFRGHPIDLTTTMEAQDRDHHREHNTTPHGLGNDRRHDTPRTQITNTSRGSTSTHPTLRFGAETFEDYMQQFMSAQVMHKDFKKSTFRKYDSTKQDSFIHWYKVFCSTCLQWGLWCPPL